MRKRLIYSALGLLLLTAAGLKLYGLNVTPFAQYGRLMSASVQFAAVEWEIVLGLWLLSGRNPVGAWLAALLTFLVFAVTSFYLGVIGQASCGCFGSVKASPWHAFAVDIIALVLLSLSRPAFRTLVSRELWWTAALRGFGVAAGALAAYVGIIGLASLAFGSPDAALARLRGERLSIRPQVVDVGTGQPGQSLTAAIEVVNRTDEPLTILGGTSDCSCVTTVDLPVTLAPGEAHQVSVQVRLPGNSGFFNRKAFFWTDCGQARRVLFSLAGRVEPPAREQAGLAGR